MTRSFSLLALTLGLALPAACSDPGDAPTGGGPGQGLSVIASDFTSTVLSLVDPATGMPSRDDCIDSGATTPVLSLALSGDVVLPSQTVPGHEVVLIDRAQGALTFLDPTQCKARAQMSVGAKSNPHDVVGLTASKAYVTRYDTAGGEGNDLAIIDPVAGKITGRIDLSAYAPPVDGKVILARPDRAVLGAGKVYVVLGALSADYMAAGGGRVVAIDPATDEVTGTIDLPGMKGCAAADFVAASKTLLVACGGVFADGAMQGAASGIVVVDVSKVPAQIKVISAAAVGAGVLSSFFVAGMAGGVALAASNGDFSGTPPDALWVLDTGAGTGSKLFDAGGAFVLGTAVAEASGARAFVTDASKATPRLYIIAKGAGGGLGIASSVDPEPARGLPPRSVSWY